MPDVWVGALGVILGAAVTALATVWVGRKDKETKNLIAACRRAVRDLERFRKLEDLYAAELAQIKGEKAETVRKKMRRHEEIRTDKIGDYGQPDRINKLARRLDNA